METVYGNFHFGSTCKFYCTKSSLWHPSLLKLKWTVVKILFSLNGIPWNEEIYTWSISANYMVICEHIHGLSVILTILALKAWFQIQWQLNCKRHITSIYIMYDVFKHHSKMLKGRKLYLNIIFWQFIGYGFITAIMHQPRTLVTPQWATFV